MAILTDSLNHFGLRLKTAAIEVYPFDYSIIFLYDRHGYDAACARARTAAVVASSLSVKNTAGNALSLLVSSL